MNTTVNSVQADGALQRIPWRYPRIVRFPRRYKKFLWDHQSGRAPLEKVVFRILYYGSFDDIKWLYKKYPEEAVTLSRTYPEIRRGVKFWMEYWNERK
jgi:hypothetical protein